MIRVIRVREKNLSAFLFKMKFRKNLLSLSLALALLVLGVALIYFYFYTSKRHTPQPAPAAPPKYAYGICIDSLAVSFHTVGKDEMLSTILASRISPGLIDRIGKETRNIFDVRRIRAGNRYAFISTKDSVPRTLYFIYEMNPVEYIIYDFRDSLRVMPGKKEVSRKIRTAGGTITASLWNTIEEKDLDVSLALNMADVFAWTVDFYGLQKGDGFKVMYEEIYVDSVMTGSDRIVAALFRSNGRDFYAFAFDQEGKLQYFDERGQSLQRSFLKAPLRFSRISSRFSRSRMHPILRIARPHYGVDYSAPKGTPVVALGDGRVTEAGWKGGYGRFISIRHNSVYTTTYAHLSGYAKGIRAGVSVRQGEVIGFVGSSGLSTGPHLDFRVYRNGKPTNPLTLESPPSRPVGSDRMPDFLQLVNRLKPRIDSIPGIQ